MARFNKKERVIFWIGLLTGIAGGVVGNFWVGSYFDLRKDFTDLIAWGSFLIFTLLFLGLIFWINSKLNQALNIKPGRPKKK